jgi:hypothetical protein
MDLTIQVAVGEKIVSVTFQVLKPELIGAHFGQGADDPNSVPNRLLGR